MSSAPVLLRAALFGLALALMSAPAALAEQGPDEVSADEAMRRLAAGNARYVSGALEPKDFCAERAALAAAQHPYAIVLACADSRVPPEILFDESLGRLFVVRVAGEVADPVVLGSVEYAAEHLGARLLVVLGHERCGAVKAALSGGDVPPNVGALVARIAPAVDVVRAGKTSGDEMLGAAVRENVRYQMHMALFQSDVLAEKVRGHELTIVGGVYDLDTGVVEFLPTSVAVDAPAPEAPPTQPQQAPQPMPHAGDAAPAGDLAGLVEDAYKSGTDVMTKSPLLARDTNGRCATPDCKAVPAGSAIKIVSPTLVAVGAKAKVLVKYGGRTFYVVVDKGDVEFPNAVSAHL